MLEKRKLPGEISDIPKSKQPRLTAESINSTPEPEQFVYEKLTLTLADHGNAVYIELITDKDNSMELEFEPTQEGCKVSIPQGNFEKKVTGSSFILVAVEYLIKILKTPRAHLKQFVIDLEPPESVFQRAQAPQNPTLLNRLLFKCNQWILLKLLKAELANFKLSVERFKMEFEGDEAQIVPILEALEPITLKEISIESNIPWGIAHEIQNLEQWKGAELLEWVNKTDVSMKYSRKTEKIQVISELYRHTTVSFIEFIKPFCSLTHLKEAFIEFKHGDVRLNDYFKLFATPGALDNNWIVQFPELNRQINVITADNGVSMFWKEKEEGRSRMFRKPDANFAEIPLFIAEKIIGPLDVMEKRSLRQTCSFLRHAVSQSSTIYEKLTLTLADNRSAIFIELFLDAENRLELEFEHDPLGYTVKNPQEGWEQTVVVAERDRYQFINGALDHFLKIFTRKTVVKKLCLVTKGPCAILLFVRTYMSEETRSDWMARHRTLLRPYFSNFAPNHYTFESELMTRLANKRHLLKVQQLELYLDETCHNKLNVLKYLDPNVLERIRIDGSAAEWEVGRVVEHEAWKRAKEFFCSGDMPATTWAHFPESVISINYLSPVKIEAILNALLTSTTWNNVFIESPLVFSEAKDFLNRLEDQRPVASRIANSKLIKIPSIPNQFINYQLIDENNILFTRSFM